MVTLRVVLHSESDRPVLLQVPLLSAWCWIWFIDCHLCTIHARMFTIGDHKNILKASLENEIHKLQSMQRVCEPFPKGLTVECFYLETVQGGIKDIGGESKIIPHLGAYIAPLTQIGNDENVDLETKV